MVDAAYALNAINVPKRIFVHRDDCSKVACAVFLRPFDWVAIKRSDQSSLGARKTTVHARQFRIHFAAVLHYGTIVAAVNGSSIVFHKRTHVRVVGVENQTCVRVAHTPDGGIERREIFSPILPRSIRVPQLVSPPGGGSLGVFRKQSWKAIAVSGRRFSVPPSWSYCRGQIRNTRSLYKSFISKSKFFTIEFMYGPFRRVIYLYSNFKHLRTFPK